MRRESVASWMFSLEDVRGVYAFGEKNNHLGILWMNSGVDWNPVGFVGCLAGISLGINRVKNGETVAFRRI